MYLVSNTCEYFIKYLCILYPIFLYSVSYICVSCILYPVSYILYTISCILYPVSYILYTISVNSCFLSQCILYPISFYHVSYICVSRYHISCICISVYPVSVYRCILYRIEPVPSVNIRITVLLYQAEVSTFQFPKFSKSVGILLTTLNIYNSPGSVFTVHKHTHCYSN